MDANKQLDKVRGCLVGGAIGDAFGYPLEVVKSYDEIIQKYGPDGLTGYDLTAVWAVDAEGKAVFSDDTQMTLFTACGLLNAKTKGMPFISTICSAYVEWLNTQYNIRRRKYKNCWIGELPELNVRRGPGHTCLNALKAIRKGEEPFNSSKGCGGLMRISPIPLYGLANRITDVEVLNTLSAASARLTHMHPLGYIPAYVSSHIIYKLATASLPDKETFCSSVKEALQYAFNKYGHDNECTRSLEQLLQKAMDLAGEDIPDSDAIGMLGEGWSADEALAIAVFSTARHFNDFGKALISAANHAGDSDSTAAIAGSYLGAARGYEAIPTYWKTNLQLEEVILHVADDLCRGENTPFHKQ